MLYLKYIIKNSFFGMCNVLCLKRNSVKKEKPLQARVESWIIRKKSRASCFGSSRASITVETSLAFPVFLCALCCFTVLAQMVLVETQMHYAVSQTAKVCAKQKMISSVPASIQKGNSVQANKGQSTKESYNEKSGIQNIKNAKSVFLSLYDGGSLCENLLQGGRGGILISSSFLAGEEVQVSASYIMKVPVPFFQGIRFQRKTTAKRRIFSGYVKHWGDYEEDESNPIVYVAENGVVYHKDSSCSHICLKITGDAAIQEVLHSSKYDACEKCIHKGQTPSALFVTAYGDCYHATLGCSGLKRTIQSVRLKDVGNLRPCSRCASGGG